MENMIFSVCERFMTKDDPSYLEGTDCKCEEIVSVDCGLFDHEQQREYDDKRVLAENEQWLAVLMMKKGEETPVLEGFEFCGYDLAEGDEDCFVLGTSSLTNCPNYFNEVFSFKDLNRYGLLDSREEAERLQELLPERYPDEQHAFCAIYAVWRKIKAGK